MYYRHCYVAYSAVVQGLNVLYFVVFQTLSTSENRLATLLVTWF